MSDLPANWRWSTVAESGIVDLGRMRHPDWHTGPEMRPYLRVANVFEDRIDASDVKEMDFSGTSFERYRLQSGDVLLNEGQTPELLGRPAIYRGHPAEVAFTNTILRFRPYPTVLPEWALLVFRHYMHSGRFTRESRITTNIAHLSSVRFKSIEFPIPPLAEQHRLVELLEDHLSRLHTAATSIVTAKRRLKVLKRALFSGLVPELGEYPAHWRSAAVADAGHIELGRQRHPDWHSGSNMKPYLRVANVFEDRIDTTDVMEMHWPGETFERFKLRPGDVLLNEGQSPEYLGRPALYRGDPAEVAFTNSLIRFQAHDSVLPEFALLVFRRHMYAGRFARESRITTNIGHLSAGRLKRVEFPIPPIAEQSLLVNVARDGLDGITYLRESIAAMEKRALALRRALLSAAFSGGLTGHATNTARIEELADV